MDKGIALTTKTKRIVFLDIDGVLNNEEFFKTARNGFINPEKVSLLNRLKEVGAEVVISSSWGNDNGRTEKSLVSCGLELPIIGYTEHFHCPWQCRGNEIAKWLYNTFGEDGNVYGKNFARYKGIDYNYVILDDDSDFLIGQQDNFVRTSFYTGLTEEDIEKAMEILTKN